LNRRVSNLLHSSHSNKFHLQHPNQLARWGKRKLSKNVSRAAQTNSPLSIFSFLEFTPLPQPGLEILHRRVEPSALVDVGLVPELHEPLEHGAELLHHVQDQAAHESERDGHLPAKDLLEGLGGLRLGELVAGEADGAVAVGGRFGVGEGQGGEDADVARADELKRNAHVAPHGGEAFAHEVRGQVVVEGGRAEDGVCHGGGVVLGRVVDGGDQVLFNLVLGDEVRDVGRVVDRVAPAAVDRAVDEVLDAGLERGVDQRVALLLFNVLGHVLLAHGGQLHGEDAVDASWPAGFGEDGAAVVQVAGEEGDVFGFGGEGLGGGGGGVAGQGQDLVRVRGWGGEEGVDDGGALLACGAGDEDFAGGHSAAFWLDDLWSIGWSLGSWSGWRC
jgi:hypothetical protein